MANRILFWLQNLFLTALIVNAASSDNKKDAVNTYDGEYGVYLGQLSNTPNSLVSGRVFIVNETTLQVIDFSFNGKSSNDAYFWLSKTEAPTKDSGFKLPTFEFGHTPLDTTENAKRFVLNLPTGNKVSEFKSLSVYSPTEKVNYGSVVVPDDVVIPKTHFLPKELIGSRYNVRSGPILILDTRTIKIFGFTFEGDKAPDGYFFVGRGLNVAHDVGTKVPIRGKDTPDSISPMNERYRGGQDIILDLPEGYDVYHIDLLSVFCYKFRVDFAHVSVNNLPSNLPPHVPPQQKYNLTSKSSCQNPWKPQPLLGNEARSNFTLQLGPSGGICGYQAFYGLRPADEYVWYVNGYLAELYLLRGYNYTFILEGGQNNSLYFSDEPFGGYGHLEANEKKLYNVFAPKSNIEDNYSERLCVWEGVDPDATDKFDTFEKYRHQLHLNCAHDGAGQQTIMRFNPDSSIPSTIYANSLNTVGMGFKIHVVDEFPADIQDIHEEPFTFEAWTHQISGGSIASLTQIAFILCSLLVLNTILDF